MNKVSGKLLLLLVLSLVFTGCADITVTQLRKEKISPTSEKKNVEAEGENDLDTVSMADTDISEAPPVDEAKEKIVKAQPEKIPAEREPDGLDGLEIIEGEEGDLLDIASMAETDIPEAPQADEAKEEIVQAKPIILASIGTFSSKRKKQPLKVDYEEAYNLYKNRDFKGAISAFSSFIVSHPSTSYTDNAFYWRGECYYSMRKFRKAIVEFDEVVNKFPKGNKVPDAMLKKGYSYIEIKNIPKAKSSLQKLIKLYPSSNAAIKAAEKIDSL